MAEPALERVLALKAAATLKRHLPSWRLWRAFAEHHDWPVFAPPSFDMIGFCEELLVSGRSASGAKNVINSLKFVATLAGWRNFHEVLSCRVVQAWREPEFRPDRREALPLPLSVVAAFEDRVHEDLASHVTQDTFP